MDQFCHSSEDIKLVYFRLSNAINLLRELKDYTDLAEDSFVTSSLKEVKKILLLAEEGKISEEIELKNLATIIRELNNYIQIMAITKLFQEIRAVKDFLNRVSSWIHRGPEKPEFSAIRTGCECDAGNTYCCSFRL